MKVCDEADGRPRWQQMGEEAQDETDAWLEELLREHSNGSGKEFAALGTRHFNLRAMHTNNNREWVNAEKLRVADAHLALEKRRVEVQEDLADEKLGPVVKPLSPEEKERRMKAIMGIA